MNIPQQNRVQLAIEHAEVHNNYIDCLVIAASILAMSKAVTEKDAESAFGQLQTAVEYRLGKPCQRIRELRKEFTAYTSLLLAIELKNQDAIDWWNREAEKGMIMRIT